MIALPPPSAFGRGGPAPTHLWPSARPRGEAGTCGVAQPPPSAPGSQPKNSGREQSRLRDVARELELVAARAGQPGFAYLDVGCAEGRITAAVAEALALEPAQAHACDVAPQPPNARFAFTQSGPASLPYGAGSFDLVTMFMAAHHFTDASAMFREARRVLRPGGYLLLRDHDCGSTAQWLFYDVVHALYGCVLATETTPTAFVEHYAAGSFATYRAQAEWLALARGCGFETDAQVPPHGPWVEGRYASDRFDSFYAFLVAV